MNQNSANQMMNNAVSSKNDIKRILYATDLTKSAPQVYQYALYLAKQCNAEIVCLHVIDTYSQKSAMAFAMCYLTSDVKQEILKREKNRHLEEMVHRNRKTFIRQQFSTEDGLYPEQLGLTVENKVVFGNVEEQILKHSIDSNCDLIVMGAHEKPFYTFTTTLSKRVTKRSRVPVTIVPLPGEREARATRLPAFFLPRLHAARCE
jgi:nucleotide-binding universal stress UspA family protein